MDGETEGTGEAQALTFGFSFPTLLGLLPTVVLIIALATVGKESPGLSSTTSFPGDGPRVPGDISSAKAEIFVQLSPGTLGHP